MMGKYVSEIETLVGTPHETLSFSRGESLFYSGAGESRTYDVEEWWMYIFYDEASTMRGLLIDGLPEKYTHSEWQKVTALLSLPVDQAPDETFPGALNWYNLDGYRVWMGGSCCGPTAIIHIVQVYIPND